MKVKGLWIQGNLYRGKEEVLASHRQGSAPYSWILVVAKSTNYIQDLMAKALPFLVFLLFVF